MIATRTTVLCIVALASQVVVAQGATQEKIHGAPTRHTTPDDWLKLQDLTEVQKIEVILTWLIEERKDPTPTFAGKGGGPIDTYYQQAQLVHSLCNRDPKVLRWLVQSKTVKSVAMRNLVGLAAALGGDLSGKSHMIQTLLTHPNPYMRELAARFLHEWQDDDVVQALERAAATDPFRVRFESADTTKGIMDGYPVRDSARNSINHIKDGSKPNGWSQRWKAKFNEKMEGYDEFVKAHKEDLERIAKLINTDRPKRIR